MARRSGRGKTPEKVIELLKSAVEKSSQLEMSRVLGVGVATVNRYLNGIGEPTQETFEKLADYFGVPVWDLRGEKQFDLLYVVEKLTDIASFIDLMLKEPTKRTESNLYVMLAEVQMIATYALGYERSQRQIKGEFENAETLDGPIGDLVDAIDKSIDLAYNALNEKSDNTALTDGSGCEPPKKIDFTIRRSYDG